MSGITATLQHDRARAQGIGTNAQAIKYLGQDYNELKRNCLECRQLFRDETFEAIPSALGFDELGPSSYKIRGVSWMRPTVSMFESSIQLYIFHLNGMFHFLAYAANSIFSKAHC